MSIDRPVAVIEVGSGSVKLLITDTEALAGRAVDRCRVSVKTRLSQGGGPDLTPESVAATSEAFQRFASLIAEHQPVETVAVATAIGRTGFDLKPVVDLCSGLLGLPLEVLSGHREAALGYAGAVHGRAFDGPFAVVDIGSRSTEVAIQPEQGEDAVGPLTWSLPLGARAVTESYLRSDPPGADELASALSVAELHYDDLRRELPGLVDVLDRGTLIGVGAISQIAHVEIGDPDSVETVDGYRLVKLAVEEVFRTLATEDREDRAYNPGLAPGHVDDIVGGLCILVEFLRRYGVNELVVSERDLRDGLAAELLAEDPVSSR